VELAVENGLASAVWEVLRTGAPATSVLDFQVWMETPGPAACGATIVTGAFAPASADTSAGSASPTLPWPRFRPSSAQPIAVTQDCSTAVDLKVSSSKVTLGTPLLVTATVRSLGGVGTPGGTLTFTENGNVVGIAQAVNGQASLPVTPTDRAAHCYLASYSGSATFSASVSSELCLIAAGGIVTITDFQSTAGRLYSFGRSTDLSVLVTPNAPRPPYSPKIVRFSINGVKLGDVDVAANGRATLQGVILAPGAHLVTVTFLGDENWSIAPAAAPIAPLARTLAAASARLSAVVVVEPARL